MPAGLPPAVRQIASRAKVIEGAIAFAGLQIQHAQVEMRGFLLATMTGGSAVLLISPKALFQYLESQHNAQSIFLRTDNASLFNVSRQILGIPGFLLVAVLIGLFLFYNSRQLRIGNSVVSDASWAVWNYLSVILLPVIWVYCLVPLLPSLVKFLQSPLKSLRELAY